MNPKRPRVLSVFSLAMINVIAIDSLRNLPINATYGHAILFFYLIGAVCFLLPCALVTAELATQWPKTGGVYVWVREAFGKKYGFINIWLQWIYNVVWFPTILAFIGASIAALINPHLADDRYYMVGMILICFLLATWLNLRGIRIASLLSEFGAIFGTILPMMVIIVLGYLWSRNHASLPSPIAPALSHTENLAFFVAVMFSLFGIEMSAVHAEEVKRPAKDYPRALLISCVIIVTTMVLSSLAIAAVVPQDQLSLINGLNQAFARFFYQNHLSFLFPVMELLIILGGFAGMAAWVLGPTKGLLVAAQDGNLPRFFARENKQGAPKNILILQLVIVIILSAIFIFLPTVASAYWLLSAMTAEIAMLYYIILFLAAITLRHKYPARQAHAFMIPGGKLGVTLVCGLGILTCLTAFVIGLIPPDTIASGGTLRYEVILLGGILLFGLAPLAIYHRQSRVTGASQ